MLMSLPSIQSAQAGLWLPCSFFGDQSLLNGIRNPEVVRDVCGQDVTYVSLNFSNPDLHKIIPWCGTGHGVDAISKTFDDVSKYWSIDTFTSEAVFGEGEHVAVSGRFTYTSTKLHTTVIGTGFQLWMIQREAGELTREPPTGGSGIAPFDPDRADLPQLQQRRACPGPDF